MLSLHAFLNWSAGKFRNPLCIMHAIVRCIIYIWRVVRSGVTCIIPCQTRTIMSFIWCWSLLVASLILRLLSSLCCIPCTNMRVSTKAEEEQQWLEKQQLVTSWSRDTESPRLLVGYCRPGLVNTVYQKVWYVGVHMTYEAFLWYNFHIW